MIVTCPNCGASYRIPDDRVGGGVRMRCAQCDHRWAAEARVAPAPSEADEDAALADVQAALRARGGGGGAAPVRVEDTADPIAESAPESLGNAADAESAADAAPDAADDPRPPRLLQTVIALIGGLALAIVAAGLWLDRGALMRLPGIGPALAQLPATSPLRVAATGVVTVLPSGRRVLEVTGTIANPGPETATVAPLAATLSGPNGVAVRWRVPPPVARLGPGQQVAFTTTATGFPAAARQLSVTAGR